MRAQQHGPKRDHFRNRNFNKKSTGFNIQTSGSQDGPRENAQSGQEGWRKGKRRGQLRKPFFLSPRAFPIRAGRPPLPRGVPKSRCPVTGKSTTSRVDVCHNLLEFQWRGCEGSLCPIGVCVLTVSFLRLVPVCLFSCVLAGAG